MMTEEIRDALDGALGALKQAKTTIRLLGVGGEHADYMKWALGRIDRAVSAIDALAEPMTPEERREVALETWGGEQ